MNHNEYCPLWLHMQGKWYSTAEARCTCTDFLIGTSLLGTSLPVYVYESVGTWERLPDVVDDLCINPQGGDMSHRRVARYKKVIKCE